MSDKRIDKIGPFLGENAVEKFGERQMALDYRKDTAYTRKVAMRVKCLDCMGWQLYEVRLCSAYTCPIWPYRMGKLDQRDNAALIKKQQAAEGVK